MPNPHILDLVSEDDLYTALSEGLVSERFNLDATLTVYNYTNKCMYTPGCWDNRATRILRGLVVDADGTVLARPMEKFFNRSEDSLVAPVEETEDVIITDKLDGSLIHIFYNPYTEQLDVASRGSFLSDQAIGAKEWLYENPDVIPLLPFEYENYTLICEWISPDNRIVVDYGGYQGLRLLWVSDNRSGELFAANSPVAAGAWRGDTTDIMPERSIQAWLNVPDRDEAEGVVVRSTLTGNMQKIKYPKYVELHRLVSNLSPKSVWEWRCEHPWEETELVELTRDLPEEFAEWVQDQDDALWDQYRNIITTVDEICGILEVTAPKASRKELAAEFTKYAPYTALLFMALDKKNLHPAIMKMIKPGVE